MDAVNLKRMGAPAAVPTDTCPLCGTRGWTDMACLQGYREDLEYHIHHCGGCGVAAAAPCRVEPEVYAAIYARPESIPGYARYSHYAAAVEQAADPLAYLAGQEASYWAIAQGLRRYLPGPDAAILEVGCGLGYTAHALRRAGYRRVLGIDLSAEAVAAARRRFPGDYVVAELGEFAGRSDERFDAVILTEVIEHLEDPLAVLAAARGLLKPGGSILCTTPNRDFGGFAAQHWATELPPVHLWWFGEAAFRHLAGQLDMAVDFIDFTPWNREHFRQFCRALRRSRRPEKIQEPVLDACGQPRVPPPSGKHYHRSRRRRLRDGWRELSYRLRHPHLWFGRDIRRATVIGAVFSHPVAPR